MNIPMETRNQVVKGINLSRASKIATSGFCVISGDIREDYHKVIAEMDLPSRVRPIFLDTLMDEKNTGKVDLKLLEDTIALVPEGNSEILVGTCSNWESVVKTYAGAYDANEELVLIWATSDGKSVDELLRVNGKFIHSKQIYHLHR